MRGTVKAERLRHPEADLFGQVGWQHRPELVVSAAPLFRPPAIRRPAVQEPVLATVHGQRRVHLEQHWKPQWMRSVEALVYARHCESECQAAGIREIRAAFQ